MTYQSPFTELIEVDSSAQAVDVILKMCTWYCKKDAISKEHCSGRDSAICDRLKAKIANDFSTAQRKV